MKTTTNSVIEIDIFIQKTVNLINKMNAPVAHNCNRAKQQIINLWKAAENWRAHMSGQQRIHNDKGVVVGIEAKPEPFFANAYEYWKGKNSPQVPLSEQKLTSIYLITTAQKRRLLKHLAFKVDLAKSLPTSALSIHLDGSFTLEEVELLAWMLEYDSEYLKHQIKIERAK